MLNRISRLTLVVGLALLAGQARTAHAQAVPFKGSGTNAMYDPVSGGYWGVGVASHTGRMSFVGNVEVVGVFFPASGVFFDGSFEGSQVIIAANGDRIEQDISGDVLLTFDPVSGLVSGTWLVKWEITGGTGRFAGAKGTTRGVAINPPFNPAVTPWAFDWSFAGTLELGKRR